MGKHILVIAVYTTLLTSNGGKDVARSYLFAPRDSDAQGMLVE